MNILIFNGSPRRKGNTAILIDTVIQGICRSNNNDNVKYFNLPELKIHPCISCGICEKKGCCVFNDDMEEIYKKIDTADRIIIASPIYFYSVTAQTKVFIDRCQTLWSRKYLLGISKPNRQQRKGYLMSVAATRGERIFEGASLTCRYALDAMDFDYAGELLCPGVDKRGVIADHPDYLAKAGQLGQEICRL